MMIFNFIGNVVVENKQSDIIFKQLNTRLGKTLQV